MEFFELISKRRSIRKFDPSKDVTDAQVDKILNAAILAPSAGNTQCWRFFVVRNKEVKEKLAIDAGHQPFLTSAPVLIVVAADLESIGKSYSDRGEGTYSIQDTAAAVENMLLAITDLGLASCWIGAFDESKVSKILGLGKKIRPLAMIPVAYSLDVPKMPKRKPLEEVVKRI